MKSYNAHCAETPSVQGINMTIAYLLSAQFLPRRIRHLDSHQVHHLLIAVDHHQNLPPLHPGLVRANHFLCTGTEVRRNSATKCIRQLNGKLGRVSFWWRCPSVHLGLIYYFNGQKCTWVRKHRRCSRDCDHRLPLSIADVLDVIIRAESLSH